MEDFLKLLDEREDVAGRERGLITGMRRSWARVRVSNIGQSRITFLCTFTNAEVISQASKLELILCRMDDPILWGILPLSYMFNPDNHRWGLGSYDLCFTNKCVSSCQVIASVANERQRTLNFLHAGPSPAHSPRHAFAIWRSFPAYRNAGDPSSFAWALHTRERSSRETYQLTQESRSHRSVQRRTPHVLHRWARHVSRTVGVPQQTTRMGSHLPRGADTPVGGQDNALLQMGRLTTYTRERADA